jgi:hypothetical protein
MSPDSGAKSGRRARPAPEQDAQKAPAGSVAELEQAIAERREHLAATIDELTARAAPKELARRGAEDLRARVEAAIRTADGQLRTERIAAVGAAVVAVLGLMVWVRRR